MQPHLVVSAERTLWKRGLGWPHLATLPRPRLQEMCCGILTGGLVGDPLPDFTGGWVGVSFSESPNCGLFWGRI